MQILRGENATRKERIWIGIPIHASRIRNSFVRQLEKQERASERAVAEQSEVVKPDPSHNKVNHHSVSSLLLLFLLPSPSKPVARLEIPVLSTLALIPLNYLTH